MIIGRFYPDIGGTEKACQQTAQKLKEQGYDITILTEYREGLPAYEVIEGIPVYRYIKGWHVFEVTYMLSVLSFLIRQRHTINGILCFGLYLFTAPAVLFCRCTGRRVFFRLGSARETGDFHRIAKLQQNRFILWCAKKADGAIAMTKEIEAELVQHGFLHDKIIRISNGVDTEMFCPSPSKSAGPFVICYVGRLAEGKGLEIFIKSLKSLKEYSTEFTALIVGAGELKVSLARQIEQCGLKEFVTLAGKVDNVVPCYQQSHAFVLPSYSEGMPLSLLEAMACGACVVATPVGGIKDIIHEMDEDLAGQQGYRVYANGILFNPGDYAGLAAALARLVSDQELRSRLGKNARATIKNIYSLPKVIRQYQGLFKAP